MATGNEILGDVNAAANEPDYVAVNTLWLALLKLANTRLGSNEKARMVSLVRDTPIDEATEIVNHPAVETLLDLDPPLEAILAPYERGDLKGTQRNIESIRVNRGNDPTEALLSLGFLLKRIRDKREHGFKSRRGGRDSEILGATRTILNSLCRSAIGQRPAK